MKHGVINLRKCIGCGKRDFKENLIRIVRKSKIKDPQNIKVCKGHSEGRGAYLCKSVECINKAKKTRRIERAFSCKINPEIYNEIERLVCDTE